MTNREITEQVLIHGSVQDVWSALTDTDKIAGWMNGANVRSAWQVGSPIAFSGELIGKPYEDRGTVLAIEPERLIAYSHWSEFSRRPDSPEVRSIVSIALQSVTDGTLVSVTHERLGRGAPAKHAAFFWRNALGLLKQLVEGTTQPATSPWDRITPTDV